VAGRDDAFGYGGNLARRLALAEDDLREALPEAAVMVDSGEAKILESALAQILKQPGLCSLRRKGPASHLVQESTQLQAVHMAGTSATVDL
jgi:hypothetical protein